MAQSVEQSAAEILALLTGAAQGQNQSLEAQFEAIRDALTGIGGGAVADPLAIGAVEATDYVSVAGRKLPRLIGPFTVDFDDVGVNGTGAGYVVLTPLEAGTFVLRVIPFQIIQWDGGVDGFETLEITVDIQNADASKFQEVYRINAYESNQNIPTVGYPLREIGSPMVQPMHPAAGIIPQTETWSLAAFIYTNGGTGTILAGQFSFYAEVVDA